MLKCISQFKRLNSPIPMCELLEPYVTRRNVRVQVVNEQSRSLKTKVEMRTINRADEMRPYRVSDFSLDNLIAVGAKLNPTVLNASPHKSVTDMALTLQSIDINPKNE